jgi:hypothetical protein
MTIRGSNIHCDAFGCGETFPLVHEYLGTPCFTPGRFLGWIFLDINRPDLIDRELAFCGIRCCEWWLFAKRRGLVDPDECDHSHRLTQRGLVALVTLSSDSDPAEDVRPT